MSAEEETTAAQASSYDGALQTIIAEIRRSKTRTEEKLKKLEADVQRRQEGSLEREAKKARRKKPLTLKKKSHQGQHEFNEQVKDCIEKAKEETKKTTSESTLTKITQALEEGLEIIAARQKIIKIADPSEKGW